MAPLQETQSTVGGSQVCIQRKKVIVRQVEPDSTAARNGVLPGDEIRAVNQEPVQGKMHFIATLSKFRPNDELVLEIIRHGAPTTISLTLDPIP
jgi:S1-C subfamily serine protease